MSLIHLTLACGERLHVHRFSVRESLSSPFTVTVLARSPDPCIDFSAVVGQPAALRVAGAERGWSGLCRHIRLVQAVDLGPAEVGLSTYEIAVVPRLWLLSQRIRSRIFQHLSIPDIARAVLEAWRLQATWRLDAATHPRLVYKVQYGETDLDFLSRLLEEAGIAYAFTHDGDGDTDGDGSRLLLSDAIHESAPRRDAPISHVESPAERTPREFVTRLSIEEGIRTDALTIRDHDFQRPAWALLGEARRRLTDGGGPLERYSYQPGAFLVERDGTAHEDRYGALLAARALDGERADRCVISFDTNAIDLHAGQVVTVEGHPRPELDPRVGLLITSLSIDGSPHGDWMIRATAVPASTPWRPARRTPKPRLSGVQSGVVVGPPGQEIHTDEHGRVRVQFPWDRDAQGSCWLRVAQGWAGAGLGLFALPRLGQEVLVAFLDGDPDAPIVVGRVANALNPMPLKLPEDGTQSVWRSATTPGGDGFNEIRIEDKKGVELVSVRAERDMAISVRNHRAVVVGGSETARTEGRLTGYVGQDAHLTIEGEQRAWIGAKQSVTVEGDQHQHIAGSAALDAGGPIHIRSATSLVIEAPDITLRAAGGFVRVDGSGVTTGGGYTQIKDGAPGAGAGADPALPAIPLRADQGPRRLPLLAFPPGLLPPMPPGRPGPPPPPLTREEMIICATICRCIVDPSPNTRPSDCVTRQLRALDEASGGKSKIKAEVTYDMTKNPPEPVMSRKEPWRPSRGKHPRGSRSPDNVIVKDPDKPPTRDNIERIVEIKIPPDTWRGDQRKAYEKIAGPGIPVIELTPQRCGCPDPEQPGEQPEPSPLWDAAEVALLVLIVVALILDDALPGGQLDDAGIPPAIARILSKLAPLLRPTPVLP